MKDQNQNTIIKIKEDLANSTEFLELQNKLSWNKGQSEINLKELLEKTNFNHLELDKKDIEHYAKLANILKLERVPIEHLVNCAPMFRPKKYKIERLLFL